MEKFGEKNWKFGKKLNIWKRFRNLEKKIGKLKKNLKFKKKYENLEILQKKLLKFGKKIGNLEKILKIGNILKFWGKFEI